MLREAARVRSVVVWMCVRVWLCAYIYANLRYAETKEWESEEKCVWSAVRRTRGAVVPTLITSCLLLRLPCSSAQGEDATARWLEWTSEEKTCKED